MSNRPESPRLRGEPIPALYAILDIEAARGRGFDPIEIVSIWLGEGVRLVQIRAKTLTLGPFVELAGAIVGRCRAHQAVCIVNDRADVARLAAADGIHVGQNDLVPADARRIIGAGAIVGLSTHTPEQTEAALAEPVDYVAIGPVFGTETKVSEWPEVGLAGVARASATAAGRLPLVAIGGINESNAADVLRSGAWSVAVISALLRDEPARAVQTLLTAIRAARI